MAGADIDADSEVGSDSSAPLGGSSPDELPGGGSFADRLNRVIEVAHPANRDPFNDREIAEMVTKHGVRMSTGYVWALRSGRKTDPGLEKLEALAAVLGVPASYLVSGERRSQVEEQLALLEAARDHDVLEIAARSVELSGPDRAAVLRIINGLIAQPAPEPDQPESAPGSAPVKPPGRRGRGPAPR